ncbi:hypothetical protein PF005_g10535 [Phytophthora fragariae]|uniref:Heat shock factor-binding protein 1 n=2 Tax=Phytophthora TaxID=4783 RepID=A0A6A3Y5M2_9STRA|nr:hypothetical protein PF011_g9619 [Phytophthora fragariae]KAE9034707.1 hypothetical protein PR001_g9623 [Phytophthora rubi]KAE9113103.1 hypothetical protein PF010_g10203 [Phytophthora fragariae]KAE9145038.1 hypothetical protein PF006_g10071 [Phytophthora fragariae]KAE9212581.1 hypothetical protein PF005_g10535 [Phytophthora fragariae]
MSSSDAAKNAGANAASNAPAGGPTDAQDLTVFVQSLLEQMQSRFAQMSDAIIGRNILFNSLHCAICCCGGSLLDEMGSRIDELEKSIGDLMEQTNEDGSDKNQEPAANETSTAKDKGESV